MGNRQSQFWCTINVFLTGGELYTTFTLLGGSGFAYNKGGLSYYILCYSVIGYILGYCIAPIIWRYAKENNLVSQPDYFATKYNSKLLGIIVSIVAILALVPYLLLQIKGLGIIINQTSYGVISNDIAVYVGSLVLVIYVIISGLKGSAKIAVIKDFAIILVVLFLSIYFTWYFCGGGLKDVFKQAELIHKNITIIPNNYESKAWFISTALLSGFGLYLWPHAFASIFAAKNPKIIKRNAVFMPIYQILLLCVFIIGFIAVVQLPNLNKNNSDLILFMLVKNNFSPWFVGVIGFAGLLTALVPGGVILLAIATLLIKNIYSPIFGHKKSPSLELMQISVPFIMATTLMVNHLKGGAIVSLLIVGYGMVVQLLPALIFSLLKKNPINSFAVIYGMLIGVFIMFNSIFNFFEFLVYLPWWIKDINIGLIAMVVNLLVMIIISKIKFKY